MVWFDFFYLPRRVLGERHISRDRKIWKKTLRLLKVKFLKKKIPSVVYPRLMQPQMFQLSILALSEKVTPMAMGYVLQVNTAPLVPLGGIEEEALRLGINNTKTLL